MLRADRAGLSIFVDDEPQAETTSLEGVRLSLALGARRLVLRSASAIVYETTLWVVEVPQVVQIETGLPPPAVAAADRPLFWSGVSAMGLGLAFVSYALLWAPDVAARCDAECDYGFQFHTFGSLRTDEDIMSLSPETQDGVLVIPLGYSLVFTGAIWAASAALFDEHELSPWLVVGAGALAGVFMYAISHDIAGPGAGRSPFDVVPR